MPGTCGELVQGAIDGLPFLVSCPVDLYSSVTVVLKPGSGTASAPADSPKAAAAAQAALSFFGRDDLAASVSIVSDLPRGKGMASSTADVAGAIFAVARALGKTIAPWHVASLALAIEPSDATMFPNIALFDHRAGRLYDDLGPPPPLDIAVLDFGGEVDTITFNGQDWSLVLRENEPAVREALGLVQRGIRENRPDLIGRGASLSADANQRLLFKPLLPAVQELARETGAVGVCVGHSGTVIGLLVDPERSSVDDVRSRAHQAFPSLVASLSCRLIGGGCSATTVDSAIP